MNEHIQTLSHPEVIEAVGKVDNVRAVLSGNQESTRVRRSLDDLGVPYESQPEDPDAAIHVYGERAPALVVTGENRSETLNGLDEIEMFFFRSLRRALDTNGSNGDEGSSQ